MRHLSAVLILGVVLLATAPLATADTSPGITAYEAQDYAAALPLLEKEAAKGDPAAQTKLGLIYAKGLGVTRDPKLARSWFDKAAVQGHAEAEYCVGVAYDFGDGVPQDLATAITWYRRAAEKGYDKAQYNLAAMLQEGAGTQKDLAAAAGWYRKAAEQGHADAQFWLARLYLRNDGIQRNMLSARMWMDRAVAQKPEYLEGKKIIDQGLADIQRDAELPTLAGGDGLSEADAISFPSVTSSGEGVQAEHRVVHVFFEGWAWGKQALYDSDSGRIYDVIEISKDGETRQVYFDITNWFGKM